MQVQSITVARTTATIGNATAKILPVLFPVDPVNERILSKLYAELQTKENISRHDEMMVHPFTRNIVTESTKPHILAL